MNSRTKIILGLILVVVGVLGRFVPHAWNFTPIVGVALFSGAYLGRKYALIVPLCAMLISDVFIGFYDVKVMLVVYASFALSGMIGLWLGKKKLSVPKLLLSSIGASTLFYLATNTAVWAFGTMYPSGTEGFTTSLVAGIPFFRNMLVGDVWFSSLLFGTYELVVSLRQRTTALTHNTSSVKS